MTPQAAAALRCPVCGGALMPLGTSLRCPQGHSYDMAKEGYVNLLAIQKRHAADPGDGKAMVRARRAFLQAGYYAPFQKALAELCLEYAPECGETHLLDAGCGEGSYDRVVYDAFAPRVVPAYWPGSTFPRMPSALRQSYCRKPLLRWAAASAPRCGMAGRMFC